ncbi:hypothetical protein PSP6_320185 [Paraburkholderia tropica]|uniref:hypothetical protein n=1 Tax=Paraburkholderia tropica TaxID=92647 RepID=UPI001CB3F4D6|nr:hypothetical protein [Paraburkholderia tropica]CAG9214241.1 hypothetical protein PSP6_320185 [Paraburkholderia tropica]
MAGIRKEFIIKLWKETVGYSSIQMAQILGLKSPHRWRDYTDENKPKGVPPANLLMLSAIVTLPP